MLTLKYPVVIYTHHRKPFFQTNNLSLIDEKDQVHWRRVCFSLTLASQTLDS